VASSTITPAYINNFKERRYNNHQVLRNSLLLPKLLHPTHIQFNQSVIHLISLRPYKQFPPLLHDLRDQTVLTALSRVLLVKLTASQQVKKFPALYGNRRFITSFTKAGKLSIYRAMLRDCSQKRKGGRLSVFTSVRTKPDVIIHDTKLQTFINFSELSAVAMYS